MPRIPPSSEADARAAIEKSSSWSDALRLLGYEPKGCNYRTLQRWAKHWGIATDHFDPNAGRRRAIARRVIPLEDVLVENSPYPRWQLKRLLRAAQGRPGVDEPRRLGRKYGVSDNAVRKWLRWYEHQAERDAARDETTQLEKGQEAA